MKEVNFYKLGTEPKGKKKKNQIYRGIISRESKSSSETLTADTLIPQLFYPVHKATEAGRPRPAVVETCGIRG